MSNLSPTLQLMSTRCKRVWGSLVLYIKSCICKFLKHLGHFCFENISCCCTLSLNSTAAVSFAIFYTFEFMHGIFTRDFVMTWRHQTWNCEVCWMNMTVCQYSKTSSVLPATMIVVLLFMLDLILCVLHYSFDCYPFMFCCFACLLLLYVYNCFYVCDYCSHHCRNDVELILSVMLSNFSAQICSRNFSIATNGRIGFGLKRFYWYSGFTKAHVATKSPICNFLHIDSNVWPSCRL